MIQTKQDCVVLAFTLFLVVISPSNKQLLNSKKTSKFVNKRETIADYMKISDVDYNETCNIISVSIAYGIILRMSCTRIDYILQIIDHCKLLYKLEIRMSETWGKTWKITWFNISFIVILSK